MHADPMPNDEAVKGRWPGPKDETPDEKKRREAALFRELINRGMDSARAKKAVEGTK